MKLVKGINEQFNFEISSGYIYLAMSAYMEEQDMKGFARFFDKQAKEEFAHAKEFYKFLFENDEKPVYEAIEKPKEEYGTFLETFKAALEHERLVTKKIKALYEVAVEEKNYAAQNFLMKFIEEQVEEEDNFRSIVTRLERINESWNGIYIFDRELAQRK